MRIYGRRMTEFGEWWAERGILPACHPHTAAAVEAEAQIDARGTGSRSGA